MKICRAGMRSFALPLVNPLSTAHGRIISREGYLLTLMDEEGRCGFGEATPLPEFGTEDFSATGDVLESMLGHLVEAGNCSIQQALDASAMNCFEAPCALSALDGALHDLAAQREGRKLPDWIRDRAGLSGRAAERVSVQALVIGDDPESVAGSAQALVDQGFETFKLKLVVSPSRLGLGLDLARVAALREVVGPTHRIRLDANEAWTSREAESALEALERFDIDFVEQPVGRADRVGLKDLDMNAPIRVAADEALLGKGWEACLELRAASIFIVKPAALGGVAPCLALFRRARELEINVVWSSLIDAAVGRALAIALAAALGREGEVHGLGTAGLLARDLIENGGVTRGEVESSRAMGLGCDLAPVWDAREDVNEQGWGDARIVEARN